MSNKIVVKKPNIDEIWETEKGHKVRLVYYDSKTKIFRCLKAVDESKDDLAFMSVNPDQLKNYIGKAKHKMKDLLKHVTKNKNSNI